MSPLTLAMCFGFAVALSVGQILFKLAALHAKDFSGAFFEAALRNYWLWLAFGWYGAASLLWYVILARAPLSLAYLFALSAALLVPVWAKLFFDEPLNARLLAAYGLVAAGLYIGAFSK